MSVSVYGGFVFMCDVCKMAVCGVCVYVLWLCGCLSVCVGVLSVRGCADECVWLSGCVHMCGYGCGCV